MRTALEDAENIKEGPVYAVDILRSLPPHGERISMVNLSFALADMVRCDDVLCDPEMNLFTLRNPQDHSQLDQINFEQCSDRLLRKFSTYKFDDQHRIVPGRKTKTENFNQLKGILLSTDLEAGNELRD